MSHRPAEVVYVRGRAEKVTGIFRAGGRDYRVLEKLSRRGGFRVFDPHAGPAGDYRILYRLPHSRVTRQKIETLRRMTGPTANRNFPIITDCVRQGRELVVVMSWVWGMNLRDLLRKVQSGEAPRPGVVEVVRLFRGLAHGLAHYHRQAEIVHGDVSAANVIVTSGTKMLVLVDFGSAWPVEQTATREHGDGVTFPYAAPERIFAHASEDFRADQFSLSVLAYQLLTLEIPFDGLGGRAGQPGLLSGAPSLAPPSSKLANHYRRVPGRARQLLDDYFQKGLALLPDERFETGRDWLAAWDGLDEALRKGERLGAWERRFVGWLDFFVRPFTGR